MSTVILSRRHYPSIAFRPLARPAFAVASAQPAVEVVRDGSDAVVKMDLPGVDVAKDVTVEVVDNVLVVRGERRDERSQESAGRTYREVRYGTFRRSFTLPVNVTGESVSASYDAGVLSVRITGAYATPQPTRIPVLTATPQQTEQQAEQVEQAVQTEQAEAQPEAQAEQA